jgi:hypothetical protein
MNKKPSNSTFKESIESMAGVLKSLKIRPQAFSPFTHTYVLRRTLFGKAELYCSKDRAA